MGLGLRVRGGRRTNLALLAVVPAAVVTGGLTFAIGGPWVRWAVVAHGVAGFAILLLAPWKASISARGLRRPSSGTSASILLAVSIVIVMITGVGHATGLLITLGPLSAMQLHVAAALACVPLAIWHVTVRRTLPRRTDLSRRTLLRSGVLVGGTVVGYAGIEGLVRLATLPGASRRPSGSYERGSFRPGSMPVTQWLNDRVPVVDLDRWALTVGDAEGSHAVAYQRLVDGRDALRTILDCTGGWYAEQEWEGVFLRDLLAGVDAASSIEVTSVTGYGRRLPAADAGRLLLATRVGGRTLSAGHGFPVRLVAPGRRGYWWVKWVDRVALSNVPWWWQPPFPFA